MLIKKMAKRLGLLYHPFRWNFLKEYVISLLAPFETAIAEKDTMGAIIIVTLTIFFPPLIILIPIYSFLNANQRITKQNDLNRPYEIVNIIHFIQQNHMQSLKEALERDLGLTQMLYKNKSMLFWCKHYNNLKAHSIVLDYTKKYVSEKKELAS
jgi:hypothetical protein